MRKLRFRSAGECMAELQLAHDGLYSLGFGGDTLNTSWYVRALTSPEAFEVEYVTAVGRDPLSGRFLDFLLQHGIGTSFVRNIADRNIGLYLISLTGAERNFTYWRNNSAARLLAENSAHLSHALDGADVIYFSGITLAILSAQDRTRFLTRLQHHKEAGATIAFDSNIRPRLWSSEQDMRDATILGYQAATLALPTFPDEQTLFADVSAASCARRIAGYGVEEVIIKDGANACYGLVGGEALEVTPAAVANVIDTTGAGDSFNAGYLAGRMAKMDCRAAVNLGHLVAGRVIGQRGALAPMSAFSDLMVERLK